MKRFLVSMVIGLFLIVIFTNTCYATAGPKAYLDEYVSVSYNYDGTPTGSVSRTGYVRVTVPNEDDVLQYIDITLANYHPNTTIENSTAYKNVVTSYPTTNSSSNIYVNTSADDQSSNYILNDTDASPTINLSITWTNQKGGTDVYDSDNVYYTENNMTFNVTIRNPSGEKNLTNVNVTIYFAQDTNAANDAVEITGMASSLTLSGVSHGTMDSWDLDSDGQVDAANWVGTLGHDTETQRVVYLKFYANTTEATNFAGDNHDVDGTSDKGGNANYTSSGSTLTGTTISAKMSRGDIRQGVDLSIKGGYWHTRGFIRNMANETGYLDGSQLTYNLSLWKIKEIKDDGTPFPVANKTGNFGADPELLPGDGRIYTTDASRSNDSVWFNTTLASGSKPYFTIEMNWEVIWDTVSSSIYTGYINTTLDLPTLYLIDMTHVKAVTNGYISPDTGNENVTINDTVTFTGNTEAPGEKLEIYSVIPGKTTLDVDKGDWDLQVGQETFQLYYINQSGSYKLNISQTDGDQTAIDVTAADPIAGTDGYINITIWDFENVQRYGKGDTIGNDMNDGGGNDQIQLTYVVTSSSEMTTGDNYEFNGTNNMTTDTGTSLTEYQSAEFINVSGRRLIGWKELIAKDPTDPSLINVTVLVEVQDGTGQGITGIKFIDYVPSWAMTLAQYQGNISVFFYDGASWSEWTQGTDFKVTDNGTTELPDGTSVNIFEIINASAGGDTWNLTDGQFINVTYEMRVSDSGLYILPTIIAAFDPTTGQGLGTTVYGIIKVNIPDPTVALQVTEGDLDLAKRVIVGKPALWVKQFDVYNPNARPVSGHFETLVFNDVMDGSSVSYYNDVGGKIDVPVTIMNAEGGRLMVWDDTVNPLESRAYEVRILTPPVLEIDRD
ncbi:hypothetical protein ACFLQO_00820, partial [Candidatus Aenigmatarchaeota archaeon]